MFQKDIENKIIDLIKKSPIGVTSSEIAKYLGISRITMTKYLAIVKEKSLIDFKQFGMAKLWFIPVNLNKDLFLRKITKNLALELNKKDDKEALIKAGKDMGDHFYKLYKEHYNSENLSTDQLIEALKDAFQKIDGSISILQDSRDRILFRLNKSPFEEKESDTFIMFNIIAGIIGSMLKKCSDYTKVCLKPSGDGNGIYNILALLEKNNESESEEGIEF